MTSNPSTDVDVAVIGGGPAGLSAAIALSRFRRRVVVIDAGRPRNAPAHGVHNFLSRDGIDPRDLLDLGRAELAGFGGRVVDDTAIGAERDADRIVVRLASGATVRARRVLVASGTVDALPEIEGLAERWGRDVVHCPFCHGWEVRDEQIGVLMTNPDAAVHQALMFAELSDQVRVLEHTAEALRPDQRAQLAAVGVEAVPGGVVSLVVQNDRLTGAQLADGSTVALQALVIATRLITRSAVLDDLGAERDSDGPGGYRVDGLGATSAPGVWAAGNVVNPYAPVVVAAASGVTAGGALNADLIAERVRVGLA